MSRWLTENCHISPVPCALFLPWRKLPQHFEEIWTLIPVPTTARSVIKRANDITGWCHCWSVTGRPEGREIYHACKCVQVVYLTFERLGNLARGTFAPVWSLSEVFLLKNLIVKSLQKIGSENIQYRRSHWSSIKHGSFSEFLMCRASKDDQSVDIPLEIRWILGSFIKPV